MMIRVYFVVSCLEGQLTFFISCLTSFRKEIILFGMVEIFISSLTVFKKPFRGLFL